MSTRRIIAFACCWCGALILAAGQLLAEPPVATPPTPQQATPQQATPQQATPQQATPEISTPEAGLQLGNRVPVSSMRYIEVDRNGCYAGLYSKFRAISIYAQSIDEAGLGELARMVDARLKENDQLRGYIVLLRGSQFDEGLKVRLRNWIKDQQLTHVKLAIANGTKIYAIADDTAIQVVFSDKRLVKYSQSFAAGKLDDAARKQIADAMK